MVKFGLAAAAMTLICAALPTANAAFAQTQTSDADRLRQMAACDAIKDETRRLTCYDSVVRSGRTSAAAGQLGMMPGRKPTPTRTPQQRFGMTPQLEKAKNIPSDRPPEVSEINAKVAAVADRGAGMWRITLADGARWQFAEAKLDFQLPRRGEDVRIRKATMGSYLMYVGNQSSVRVVRVN